MERHEVERQLAVERFQRGESVEAICASSQRSKSWLYKWLKRAQEAGDWYEDHSRRPHSGAVYAPAEREVILTTRRRLEDEGNFVSAQMIAWELEAAGIEPPSVSTIKRIIKSAGLIRSARRLPKGTRYPAPQAVDPGAVHQADFVGPRHVGGVRFYSFNAVDVAIARAAAQPIESRQTLDVIPGLWSIWTRLGIPRILQMDNELVFFGNRRSPRAMGQLLRLCFELDVEVLFIPVREPWRNSVVEKFNDHWNRKLYRRIQVHSFSELLAQSLAFEERHNRSWRYSKLNGRTPNDALAASTVAVRLPSTSTPPPMPYAKPTKGRVSLVRLIRSDGTLEVFGERFKLPPEATYEYVKATVDIAAQELSVVMHERHIERFPYRLPRQSTMS